MRFKTDSTMDSKTYSESEYRSVGTRLGVYFARKTGSTESPPPLDEQRQSCGHEISSPAAFVVAAAAVAAAAVAAAATDVRSTERDFFVVLPPPPSVFIGFIALCKFSHTNGTNDTRSFLARAICTSSCRPVRKYVYYYVCVRVVGAACPPHNGTANNARR